MKLDVLTKWALAMVMTPMMMLRYSLQRERELHQWHIQSESVAKVDYLTLEKDSLTLNPILRRAHLCALC